MAEKIARATRINGRSFKSLADEQALYCGDEAGAFEWIVYRALLKAADIDRELRQWNRDRTKLPATVDEHLAAIESEQAAFARKLLQVETPMLTVEQRRRMREVADHLLTLARLMGN